MRPSYIEKVRKRLRTRQLSSPGHTGRYSRDKTWEKVESFVKRQWRVLGFLAVFPSVIALPIAIWRHGTERWIVVGAAGISGLWLVGTFTLLWTGVSNTLMGLVGESYTADVLRKFRAKGWKLVNGIKIIGKADVDSVLVGPGGLIVVETKWSGSRWPIPDSDDSYMYVELDKAVEQVIRNRKKVELKFGGVIAANKIRAICVLWSSQNSSKDRKWIERDGVTVIRGGHLALWMESLDASQLSRDEIAKVWHEIETHAFNKDAEDLKEKQPRPTFDRLMLRIFWAPLLGVVFPIYEFILASSLKRLWVYFFTFFLSILIGMALRRNRFFRPTGLVWITTTLGIFTYSLIRIGVTVFHLG